MTMTASGFIGDRIGVAHASDVATATAGGTGDATEVVGQILDRYAYTVADSVLFVLSYMTALTAAKTLSFAYSIEHGDAANLSDAAVLQSDTAKVAATGAGTVRDVYDISANLRGAKRYVRLKFTPDLSHTSTDTAEVAAVAIFR